MNHNPVIYKQYKLQHKLIYFSPFAEIEHA